MTKLPYYVYRSSLPPGSGRRISIGVVMILLTIVFMFFYVQIFHGRENLVWGLYAIPVLMFFFARKWINSGSKLGIDVLRFDEGCRNFEFCWGNEVIAFRAEEARFLKQENGQNFFDVRGRTLSFPVRVYSTGNLMTEIVLSDPKSLNMNSITVDFEDGLLKVWRENLF